MTTEKNALSVLESCEYLGGISRPTLYRLLGRGELSSFGVGSRRFITKESLDKYIEANTDVWVFEGETDANVLEDDSETSKETRYDPKDYRG